MGTSVSHSSPRSKDQGGKEWRELDKKITDGSEPRAILTAAFTALKAQHKESFGDVVFDKGVKVVLSHFVEIIKKQETADEFLIQVRKGLSKEKANSFYAELAIGSASEALLKKTNTETAFLTEYVSRVTEYLVSRDLPQHMGSLGNLNLSTNEQLTENLKVEIKKAFDSSSSIEAFLRNIGVDQK